MGMAKEMNRPAISSTRQPAHHVSLPGEAHQIAHLSKQSSSESELKSLIVADLVTLVVTQKERAKNMCESAMLGLS